MTLHNPRRVLLLAASLGSGHLRAAAAVEAALRVTHPACLVKVVDIKPLISPWLRFFQFHGYEFLIEYTPWVWRLLYQSPLMKNKKYAAPKFLLQHGNLRLIEVIKEFSPEVVVSTQINCHELAYFISHSLIPKPQRVAIVTDYDAHPIWSKTPSDLIVVGHQSLKEKLVELGLAPSQVEPYGIPIDLSFRLPMDRATLCVRFGLRTDIPILLVMGGSVGFGELDHVVEDLLRSETPYQILAVAGRNEAVRLRLEKLQKRIQEQRTRNTQEMKSTLQVFGYVDFISELMTVADCFITKPGGLATTEAVVKALPMIFVNPIAGHEEKNAKFFVTQGAALTVDSIAQLRTVVKSAFENHRKKLFELREATHALAHPDSALRLAERILGAN